MFDDQKYCPYTGLRSFSEDEAIYFKGRDLHIEQATKQLEQRKFLMLTGASGDGKSSLVYAGIIPHARAGFLKATYSNWLVADFKPERHPFQNLCKAIALALNIPNQSTVETELSHGFSSLADLYRNSDFYIDKRSTEWQQVDEEERLKTQRKSANLLVLADQFEEFFTYPENFSKGAPSYKSNLVVNLLLETARIAREEDLPIYVVCTMRSDFTGQCAAFRGLPEYIGFSQFFVPRLNRKQLREVIEEPALLSGNSISSRLVERLIHDIEEGGDQLPILQHALNQIWVLADEGNKEMDLLQYAMVGGMKGNQLPDEDQATFTAWFKSLPEKIRDCYDEPGLQNVLNTHANKLYVSATDAYNSQNRQRISEEDAQHILHNIFVCLTKIDHSRAVRNRMSLSEISDITDIEGINPKMVKELIQPFRAQGNTLVSPYLQDGEADTMDTDDTLDISHESLIRNWTLLKSWAWEEQDHVNTYSDLKQQVNRWIDNDKSSDYLLPIGTLTYFEDWFKKTEPNKFWVGRYLDGTDSSSNGLALAETTLNDSENFVKRSARKHYITRAFMRIGARRIAVALAILSLLVFSSFAIHKAYSRLDTSIYNKFKSDGLSLLSNPRSNPYHASNFIAEVLQKEKVPLTDLLVDLSEDRKYILGLYLANNILIKNQKKPNPYVGEALQIANLSLANIENQLLEDNDYEDLLFKLYQIVLSYDYANYFIPNEEYETLAKENSQKIAAILYDIIINNNDVDIDAQVLYASIVAVLNHASWSNDQLDQVISRLSPFEPSFSNPFDDLFSKDKRLTVGRVGQYFNYNGLYQILAYLYASKGDLDHTLQCVDSLTLYNEGYIQNNYFQMIDNATNVAGYFIDSGNTEMCKKFVDQYCRSTSLDKTDFYLKYLSRTTISWHTTVMMQWEEGNRDLVYNSNLNFISLDSKENLYDLYEAAIGEIGSEKVGNFTLAEFFKLKGLMVAQGQLRLTNSYDTVSVFDLYDKSMQYYLSLDDAFLDGMTTNKFGANPSPVNISRRNKYLYPDDRGKFLMHEARVTEYDFLNGSFLDYLLDKKLVTQLYQDAFPINRFDIWSDYQKVREFNLFRSGEEYNDISLSSLNQLLDQIQKSPSYTKANMIVVKARVANLNFETGNIERALEIAQEIDFKSIQTLYTTYEWLRFRELADLAYWLVRHNQQDLADEILAQHARKINKTSMLAWIGYRLAVEGDLEKARSFISEAQNLSSEVESPFGFQIVPLTYALSSLPDQEGYADARHIWKGTFDDFRTEMEGLMYSEMSRNGLAYLVDEEIDKRYDPDRKLEIYEACLRGLRQNSEEQDTNWANYNKLFDYDIIWIPFFEN